MRCGAVRKSDAREREKTCRASRYIKSQVLFESVILNRDGMKGVQLTSTSVLNKFHGREDYIRMLRWFEKLVESRRIGDEESGPGYKIVREVRLELHRDTRLNNTLG